MSSKIHAIVDAYGCPIFMLLSEGQEHDSSYEIDILSNIKSDGSYVLAHKGYDYYKIIDYIYENDGEPIIPTKINHDLQRQYDWWLYKERHLVENFS